MFRQSNEVKRNTDATRDGFSTMLINVSDIHHSHAVWGLKEEQHISGADPRAELRLKLSKWYRRHVE